MIMTMRFEKKL